MPRNDRPGKSAPPGAARNPNSPEPPSAASVQAESPARPPKGEAGFLDRTIARLGGAQRYSTAASVLFLALLLTYSLKDLLVSLSRSWFFSSDEYVFAAEVIRFLNLDFHQRYFDMPGTPYMLLTAILWAVFYPVQTWFRPDPASGSIVAFTYNHLDWFFTVLRFGTIFFYALSLVLLFLLVKRLLNGAGACVACLLLAMSPIYAGYSSFCRVESMAICLALSALLIAYRAMEKDARGLGARPTWRDPMIWAGFLVGAAAAARLHSVAASAPLLWLVVHLDERTPRAVDYPRWALRAAAFQLPAMFLGGIVCYWEAVRRVVIVLPHAAALFSKAGIACAVAPVAAVLLYRFERTRPFLLRVASPAAIKMALGCVGGFLLANCTVLWQYNYFVGSIDMYSGTYIDWQRTTWPLWTNIRWYVAFYLKVFAPDSIVLILLAVSIAWIAISRDRRLLPYLVVFLAFFVSKPINLIAAPHHTLLWLPWFAVICAFPVARIYSILAARAAGHRGLQLVPVAVAAALFAVIATHLTNGPREAAAQVRGTEERLQNISKATDWIEHQTPLGVTVAMSYFCYNPDVFYTWMKSMAVPVPGVAGLERRRFFVWEGDRQGLRGFAGYVCGTGGSAAAAVDRRRLNVKDPNGVLDLYSDPDFERVASFGSGPNEVDLFRFDYRPGAGRVH